MNRRLNVLFITPWYPSDASPSGGVFVREHAKAVARYNNVVVLHSAGRPKDSRALYTIEENADIAYTEGLPTYILRHQRITLPTATRFNELACLAQAMRKVQQEHFRPDIIHANIHKVALLSLILGKLYRLPLVITEHSSAFPRKLLDARELRYARIAFSRASTVMPVSLALQKGIESCGIEANFQIVPNVVDTDIFALDSSKRQRSHTRKLLCVGNMPESEVKGYRYLFEALALLDPAIDWSLNVIGEGPMRTVYQQQVIDLGIANKVHFLGHRSKADIVEAMQEADLFVLASVWDNMPCVLLEAMATGLPICATNVGGIPEIVSSECGMLARPADADSLCESLTSILQNLDRYDARQISEIANSRYSAAVVGQKIDTIYRQALGLPPQ